MCSTLEKNDIDYMEFEFWFMRFSNGKFDLDYDRRLEPKTRKFLDMPILILDEIFGKLTPKVRLITSQVCQSLQTIIQNPGFKNCMIEIHETYAVVNFDNTLCYYCNGLDDKRMDYENFMDRVGWCYPDKQYTNKEDYMKVVFEKMSSFLNIEHLQLEKLETQYISERYANDFELMLKSLNRKIHVKRVETYNEETLLLPYLEAGKLEKINLRMDHSLENSEEVEKTKQQLKRLLELEQCQKMGMLKMEFCNIRDVTLFPIELFSSCPRCILYFYASKPVPIEISMRFIKTVTKSSVFEFFRIQLCDGFDIESIKTQLAPLTMEVPTNPNVLHFPIANSNEFFEIELNRQNIQIERKH